MLRDPTLLLPCFGQWNRNGISNRLALPRDAQPHGATVFTQRQPQDVHPAPRHGHLVSHDLIAGAHGLEAVAGADMLARLDLHLFLSIGPILRLQWTIERDAKFV